MKWKTFDCDSLIKNLLRDIFIISTLVLINSRFFCTLLYREIIFAHSSFREQFYFVGKIFTKFESILFTAYNLFLSRASVRFFFFLFSLQVMNYLFFFFFRMPALRVSRKKVGAIRKTKRDKNGALCHRTSRNHLLTSVKSFAPGKMGKLERENVSRRTLALE